MRLIDADALKDRAEIIPLTFDGGIDINDFEKMLDEMPTVDAEPVIRCKDCKHCRTYYHGENMPFTYACDKLYLTNNLSGDDYCSRGVRKEE